MIKRILFTFLLLIICVFSFYTGLKPFGPLAAWQDQNEKPQVTEAETTAKASAKTEGDEDGEKDTKNKSWKTIHQSFSEKTDQLMKVWGSVKSVYGTINILYTTDVKAVYPAANPLEVLVPTNNIFNRISNLFRWALTALILEKTLLALSVSLVLLILIPICALISIYFVWTYKNEKKLYRVAIVSVLICLVILLAVPICLKLSTITDEKILSRNVNNIISSLEETEENAGKFNSELRRFRRTEASINSYLSTSNDLSNTVIKDSISYLQIFFMINILIPVLIFIILYKVTRFSIKLIMKK
jgi:hypothetical protein